MPKKDLMTVGVIVARFQVDELHEGHKWLIREVSGLHQKTLIVLGVHGGVRTKKDPLSYRERKFMVKDAFPFPTINVLPLDDHPFSHDIWSKHLDTLIANEYPDLPATIYGSRDSITDPAKRDKIYTGSLPTVYLKPSFKISGTEARAAIAFPNTKDARAAIIWDQMNRYDYMYSTSDLAIRNPKTGLVLLTGKEIHSGKLAFMGGHSEKADHTAMDVARRENAEEIRNIEIGPLTAIDSITIDDPRYRGTGDGVMTNFFVADFLGGVPAAGSDVDYVQWVHPAEFIDVLVPWHQELGNLYIDFVNKEKKRAAA